MIKIHYVPPSAPSQTQDAVERGPSWSVDQAAFNPFETETVRLSKGTRSKLMVEGVGSRGSRRRNQRDALALSKEWQALSSQIGASQWQGLHDATTRLDKEGRPNLGSLKQAQRQLRQWFYMQNQKQPLTPDMQAQAARVDGLLERLIRRNLVAAGRRPQPAKGPGSFASSLRENERVQSFMDLVRPDARTATMLHKKGLRHWAADRPDAALSAFEQAADKDPKNARIQMDMGKLLLDEGHYNEAEWAFMTADELAPKKAEPQLALGELYLEIGQPLMAIEAFKKAIARNPQDTDAHAQLGVAYYEQGNLEEATPHLQKAVMLDQQCVVARFYLAQVSLQENDLLRARFQLGMVAKLSPTMDLGRFQQATPQALAATSKARTTPLHHWQVPGQGTTGLGRSPGTSALQQE